MKILVAFDYLGTLNVLMASHKNLKTFFDQLNCRLSKEHQVSFLIATSSHLSAKEMHKCQNGLPFEGIFCLTGHPPLHSFKNEKLDSFQQRLKSDQIILIDDNAINSQRKYNHLKRFLSETPTQETTPDLIVKTKRQRRKHRNKKSPSQLSEALPQEAQPLSKSSNIITFSAKHNKSLPFLKSEIVKKAHKIIYTSPAVLE